jgi:hypothetical protein
VECVAGKQPASDGASCTACSGNTHSPNGVSCLECRLPNIVDAARRACTPKLDCGPGTECTKQVECTRPDECTNCGPGRASLNGELCAACATGAVPSRGNSACITCSPGRGANPAATACVDCAEGRYAKYGVCQQCVPPSTVSDDNTECREPCPPAQVSQDLQGPCSPGQDKAAGMCATCAAGMYSYDGQQCLACPSPFVVNQQHTACLAAFQCAPGTACTDVCRAQSECSFCGRGRASLNGEPCAACTAGTVPNRGNSACITCSPGRGANPAATACADCMMGRYAKYGTCLSCSAPNIVTDESSECTQCKAGFGPNSQRTSCEYLNIPIYHPRIFTGFLQVNDVLPVDIPSTASVWFAMGTTPCPPTRQPAQLRLSALHRCVVTPMKAIAP